jgi:lipopolysaccharide/colanic/teichoic acid biosynthesis glycosyltransferase
MGGAVSTAVANYCVAPPDRIAYFVLKRALDVALSSAGLVLCAPLCAVIAMVTCFRSGRPAIIGQVRVGRAGRLFRLYKFRTLPTDALAESDRRWLPVPTDAWGRFLRASGLDELPQLWNVLRGDMSLVGPRPERPRFVEQFERDVPAYACRHALQVGMTGWAQINGWRGNTSIATRVEHDLYYLRHWSLGFDLRILWMTLMNLPGDIHRAASNGALHVRSL